MNAVKTLAYLTKLPGVEGSFITNENGDIVASQMPELYDQELLEELATGASNILETFRAEMEDCRELKLSLELKTLFARQNDHGIMFVLLESDDHAQNVRIAANVAAKRFVMDPQTEGSPRQTQSSSISKPSDDPPSEKSVSITSALFGRRIKKKKEPKPPKDNIWG